MNGNLKYGVGAGIPGCGVFAVVGLCFLAFAVPCVADEAREAGSGKREAVEGTRNIQHSTLNTETLPLTPEGYQAELKKIQNMLRDRRIALGEAERALQMRQRELEASDERCGALAKEIRELRAEIAKKEKDLSGLFEQDEEVMRLKGEIEKRHEAIQEAREKLAELVERRRGERSTFNIQHPTSNNMERPIFNVQHGENEGE